MAKKSRSLNVDMNGVETGGILVPEGDYLVEVSEVVVAESESSSKEYLKWKLEIMEGSSKGLHLYHNTSLQPQALFNLKGVLISLGVQVPSSTLKLDLDDLEGRQMGVTVEHEIYEGKKKARVTETFPWADSEAGGDDSEVDLESMDLDELLEYAAENDIDLSGLTAKAKKNQAKVLAAIQAALEEETPDDEGGEDDDGLDDLDLKGLKAYAKSNGIDISDLSAKDAKNEDKVREAIRAASIEEESSGDDSTDDEGSEFDSMSLKELKAYAIENDIEIPAKIAKDVEKVRALIIEEAGETDDEGPDFDNMSLKELKAFAIENDIEIPAKIAKNEDKVRAFVIENAPEADGEDGGEEVDLDTMDLEELLAFAADQGIAISKKIRDNEKKVRAWIVAEMEE